MASRVWNAGMFPLIYHEIPDFDLSRYLAYWRSKSGHEVDFLIGTRTAIEVKASRKISRNDFKGLNYLKEEGVFQNLILVSQDPVSILTVPWQKFLSDLWEDRFV